MSFRTRTLAGGVSGVLWSVIGTEAIEWFGFDGPIAPVTALLILVVTVAGYSLHRQWGLKTTVYLSGVTTFSFVGGFVLYFAWSASTSFPDTASFLLFR